MIFDPDLARAAARAYSSTGFRRAFVRGALARKSGADLRACPYRRRGWSAWRSAWAAGWKYENARLGLREGRR